MRPRASHRASRLSPPLAGRPRGARRDAPPHARLEREPVVLARAPDFVPAGHDGDARRAHGQLERVRRARGAARERRVQRRQDVGAGVTVPKSGDAYDYKGLTACAKKLKNARPDFREETQVTVTANPGVDYKTLIAVMDALRADGEEELFPDVHFGVAR